MIFQETSKAVYKFIIDTEVTFLTEYKVNPFQMFGDLALMDMFNYMQGMQQRLEAKEKQKQKGGKDLGKALASLRDILNYMYG